MPQLLALRLPEECRVDGLDLTPEGAFRSVCVRWPTSFGEEFRMIVEATLLEWWDRERARPRPPAARPKAHDRRPAIFLRSLVMRAVEELREEFAERVASKLARILGSGTSSLPARVRSTFGNPTPEAPGNGEFARIRGQLLRALADGRPRSWRGVLEAGRFFEDQAPAVREVMHRLLASGEVVRPHGARHSYVLRR